MSFKKLIFICVLYFAVISLIGCDAFVRKFTRKSKKDNAPQEELVLAPQEYQGPNLTQEELYRQYFLYWKSWQDELITSLSDGGTHKKQIDCAEEALKNLQDMRALLKPQMQEKLDKYIIQLNELKDSIIKDVYGARIYGSSLDAQRIKRNILRDFSYNKIKDNLA
jgi:hypothetical protein